MIGGGGRYDLTACRDMKQIETCRQVTRARQKETACASRTLGQSTPKKPAQHRAGVAVNTRCSIWLVVLLGVCALSLSEGTRRWQGLRSLLCPSAYHVYPHTFCSGIPLWTCELLLIRDQGHNTDTGGTFRLGSFRNVL